MNGLPTQRAFGERALADAFERAPLSWFSGAVGWLSRKTLPRPVRRPLFRLYASYYDVDLAEAELPLADYPSFGEFFARRLVPGARPQTAAPDQVTSPCDGTLAARGSVADGRLLQAKGRDYRLAELVADEQLAAELAGGTFLTVYLSPRDYHRVHSPVAGRLTGYTWVPGKHLPVSAGFVARHDALFARNERIVLRLDTALGPVAVVMIAAMGVANMSITAVGRDSRSFRGGDLCRVELDQPVAVARGGELGAFHLGSTVVVVFPANAVRIQDDGADRMAIRVGDPVAAIGAADKREDELAG